jgi:hypothetical protein
VTLTSSLPLGRHTIAMAVPLDCVAIGRAPGDGDAARLVASEPTDDGWEMTFDVTAAADVSAAVTPLPRRLHGRPRSGVRASAAFVVVRGAGSAAIWAPSRCQ